MLLCRFCKDVQSKPSSSPVVKYSAGEGLPEGGALRAALELHGRDAELAGLVREVSRNAAAAEDEDADRQDFQHRVVTLVGSLLCRILLEVGLEGDLRHVVGYGQQHNEAAWAARLPRAYEFLFPVTEAENPLKVEMFTGDLDHDADMDAEDLALFDECLAGPSAAPENGCSDPDSADLNGDGFSDLADYAIFQRFHSGPR